MSRVHRRRKDCIHVQPGTPRQPPGSQYVSERLVSKWLWIDCSLTIRIHSLSFAKGHRHFNAGIVSETVSQRG